MRTRVPCLWLAVVVALLVACATVPISGRSQVILVSDQDVARLADQHHAKFLAEQRQKGAIVTASDPSAGRDVDVVNRVGRRIIDAAGIAGDHGWEITLVRDKQANAFVLPNGKIVVYTGLLPVANGEPGLAAILGHEVAHVVARHSAERVSQDMLAQAGMSAASVAASIYDPRFSTLTAAALGIGLQVGVMLPYSRAHESEADHLGLIYMAKAGYDPAEAIALWERMDKGGGRVPEFLSTHPNPATRRAHLRELLPEARAHYRPR